MTVLNDIRNSGDYGEDGWKYLRWQKKAGDGDYENDSVDKANS